MSSLVTLAEAKEFIRVMDDHEDNTIATMIAAASETVRAHVELWDGVGEAPATVKLAVLARVAIAFDQRDSLRPGEGEDRLLSRFRALDV